MYLPTYILSRGSQFVTNHFIGFLRSSQFRSQRGNNLADPLADPEVIVFIPVGSTRKYYESLFLGFLKEDLFYFSLNNFSKIFIFRFLLSCRVILS